MSYTPPNGQQQMNMPVAQAVAVPIKADSGTKAGAVPPGGFATGYQGYGKSRKEGERESLLER